MADDPRPPFTVPPGGGPGLGYGPPGPPTAPSSSPPVPPGSPVPAPAPPPAMPPLGPPYLTPPGPPPDPRYPTAPPEQWPAPPPLLPVPVTAPPSGPSFWTEARQKRLLLWCAVAAVIAVVAGVLIGSNTGTEPHDFTLPRRPTTTTEPFSTQSSSREGTTTTTTEPAQDLNSVVIDIEHFVERERGLTFKQPVNVHLAGEGEFQTLLLKDFDKERPGLLELQQVLDALALVPKGSDVVSDERSLLEIGVVGFYDPETKQLVVRGEKVSPYVRHVLAHELTHALDDQYFDLNRPQLDNADDESGFGFTALAEGNARRIENAYLASLSLGEQADALAEEQGLISQHPEVFSLPDILINLIQAPYDDGPKFVQDVLDAGGQARLDQSFTAPPVTSEQILDPQKFLAGEGPADVPTPAADGTAENVGVLGELLLREMLFDSLSSSAEVDRAVKGWGGDRYVTWTDATGKTCLRDSFVGDTPNDTLELRQAVTKWADDHSGSVDVSAAGFTTLTVCA